MWRSCWTASRRIVGWSMAEHLRTGLVLDALDMAIAQRQPGAGLVHHSDHGCQPSTPAWPSAAASSRPAWSPRWAPSATPGQRRGRELLRHPGMRAAGPLRLANPPSPPDRRIRLHRGLLQPPPASTQHPRLPHTFDYERQHPSPAPAA
jgi:hypothetical protein